MNILLVLVQFHNVFKGFLATLQIQHSLHLHISDGVCDVVSKLDVGAKRYPAHKREVTLAALKLEFHLRNSLLKKVELVLVHFLMVAIKVDVLTAAIVGLVAKGAFAKR